MLFFLPLLPSCSINGVPACANQDLLINKLRKEWKFKGYIISDAGAISNILVQHRYVKTKMEAAVAAIKAGCNMELTGEKDEYFLTQVRGRIGKIVVLLMSNFDC